MRPQAEDVDQLLIEAARRGNVEVMQLLLGAGLRLRSRHESQRCESGAWTAMDAAVEAGRKDMVRLLLAQGCDPNAPDLDDPAPSCRAVRAGHKLVVLAMLEAGAHPDIPGRLGVEHVLDIAAAAGRADLMRILLAHGATSGTNGAGGNLAIGNAARSGHLDALEFLLDSAAGKAPGAAVQALFGAVSGGHEQMIRRLVARGIDVNLKDDRGRTPLHAALEQSVTIPVIVEPCPLNKTAELLLELGADPNIPDADEITPLNLAVVYGHTALAETFLAKGARLDVFSAAGLGRTEPLRAALAADPTLLSRPRFHGPPLVWAAATGQTATVKWLLDHGNDASAGRDPKKYRSVSPLAAAVRRGDAALVAPLLDRGADANAPHEDALYAAVSTGRTELVKLLLDHKAIADGFKPDRGAPFAEGSPLHVAARNGYATIVALLLNHRADFKCLDWQKHTPLEAAVSLGFGWYGSGGPAKELSPRQPDRVVTLLLAAYREQQNKPPQHALDAALCWAAGQGNAASVTELLDAGANVNAHDRNARTPLLAAVCEAHFHLPDTRSARTETRQRYLAVIKLLLARGTDPGLGDRYGNALWYSRNYLHDGEFVELLSTSGTK
jgi:ankyrin repeat protein